MSAQAWSYVVKNSRQKGGALLLLLMIANHAHADGSNAYPSVKTLAAECRMSVRQVIRLVALLEKSGELIVERSRGGRRHNYAINMAFNPDKVSPSNTDKKSGSTLTSATANTDKSCKPTLTFATSPSYKEEPFKETVIEPEEEEAPTVSIEDVTTDLTIQQTEKAFGIRLDLATRKLVAESVPSAIADRWPSFVKARAVGFLKRSEGEKLARIGYALTDFQRDNRRDLQNGNNSNGYQSERDRQDERIKRQRAEEEELARIGLAKREAAARRALSGDSAEADSPDGGFGESTALIR
jgi:hypothetical protein